jgi:hypothetical protein
MTTHTITVNPEGIGYIKEHMYSSNPHELMLHPAPGLKPGEYDGKLVWQYFYGGWINGEENNIALAKRNGHDTRQIWVLESSTI